MTDEQGDGLDSLRAKLAGETARADANEAKLKAHLIDSGLRHVARQARAFNENQVATLLRPNAALEPAVDADGNPTGEYNLFVMADDGKKQTPREATDKLRAEQVNLFFRPEDLTGADDRKYAGESPTDRIARLARTDPAAYRRERVKLLGLRPRNGARK